MIVLIGESGAGKTTIEKRLCERYCLKRAISVTTRPPRQGEKDGEDYYFFTEEEFISALQGDEFAEHVTYRGWHYGLLKSNLEHKDIVVVEPNGLEQLRRNNLKLFVCFIHVPERERTIRLLKRGDDVDEVFRRVVSDRTTFKGLREKADCIVENVLPVNNAVTTIGRILDRVL